jgi:hypothetical protein
MAVAVAEQLEIAATERREIHYAALPHDIGELAVPDAILHSTGLTRDTRCSGAIRWSARRSWRAFRSRATCGESSVTRTSAGTATGTPMGWPGRTSRSGPGACSRADPYHTMISDRPHQPDEPVRARAEPCACAGSKFDPDVDDAMIEVLEFDGPPLMAAARAQACLFLT